VTVWLVGCVVIEGGTAAAFTVSVAVLLVTVPAVLLTSTRNVDPLSDVVVAGMVELEEVAPAMFAPFFCH
jgi:hypothetical protein